MEQNNSVRYAGELFAINFDLCRAIVDCEIYRNYELEYETGHICYALYIKAFLDTGLGI